ncbi:MAG: hypothetical protein OXE85_06465 [Roseovarius sp.]|nr:hypothetical protein [Roseovarius sp.]
MSNFRQSHEVETFENLWNMVHLPVIFIFEKLEHCQDPKIIHYGGGDTAGPPSSAIFGGKTTGG